MLDADVLPYFWTVQYIFSEGICESFDDGLHNAHVGLMRHQPVDICAFNLAGFSKHSLAAALMRLIACLKTSLPSILK